MILATLVPLLLSVRAAIPPGPAPWTARELQRRVDASITSKATRLRVPGGDYVFDHASLTISEASNFELASGSGGPVRLWFDIGFGVLVQSSTGVAVTGPIELDYTTGAYYQGSVIGTNVTDGTCGAMVLAFTTHWGCPPQPTKRYNHDITMM